MEAREVVHEERALAHPLSVELAPARLRPAGLGDREVQSVALDLVPVLRRHEVAEAVEVAVERHLRIARRAAREEHEHRVLAAGRVGAASVDAREADVLPVEAAPSLAVAVHDELRERVAGALLRDLGLGELRLVRHVAVRRADERLHVRRLEAVDEVVVLELAHRRDHDRADLVERERGRPVLPVALQDEEDLVALADPERAEVVRHLVRQVADLAEREAALGEVVADVQERELVGVAPRDLVDDVEREVEALGVLEADVLEVARRVLLRLDVAVDDERDALVARTHRLEPEVAVAVLARHHHREERDAVRIRRHHAVRRGRAVVDGVALLQLLDVLADAHLHRAFEDDVELLSRVRRRGDRLVEKLGVVLVRDPVGRAEAVAEHRRLVADVHVRLVRGQRALPRARDFVAGEVGGVALQERVDVDTEGDRALVEEVERRIDAPRLDSLVVLDGDFGLLRHLLE